FLRPRASIICDLPACRLGRSRYGLREPPGTRLPPVFTRRISPSRRSEQRRRRHGVRVPPVRLRLDLGVQVEQVRPELVGVGREMRTVRTRLAFWHLDLLSAPLTRRAPSLRLSPRNALRYRTRPPLGGLGWMLPSE